MKNKKYHTVGTIPKSYIKIVERGKIDTPNTKKNQFFFSMQKIWHWRNLKKLNVHFWFDEDTHFCFMNEICDENGFQWEKKYCKNNYWYFWQNPILTYYWTHLMNIKPKYNNRTHELKFVVKIIILVNKIKTTNDNSKIVNISCHCCVRSL